MPLDKMISIGQKLKTPLVLLGGKNDTAISSKLKEVLGENAFDACGKFSLNESAALVKYSSAVITHDTGLMHIAAAFRKRIISLWGNTVPEFGMYPYLPSRLKENSTILEVQNLRCRPCSKIGFDKCRALSVYERDRRKCFRGILKNCFSHEIARNNIEITDSYYASRQLSNKATTLLSSSTA
ncbi:MAG: glycosyltransferase family 9 protein [Bacteroidia bacterium]